MFPLNLDALGISLVYPFPWYPLPKHLVFAKYKFVFYFLKLKKKFQPEVLQ